MKSAERAVDALYETPPDAFTKKRDALVRELKEEGDDERAAELKRLRKPTRVAYVLNQLARRYPDDVANLVDVGRDLARAQREALRGRTSEGLREVIARQREVVSDVTRRTGDLMRELEVGESGLDEVAGALRAALVDPAVGAALEEGRLEKVPAPATGFPGAELAIDLPPPPKKPARTAKEKKVREKEKKKHEAKEKRESDRQAREAERRRALRAKADAADEDARAREDEAAAATRIAKERLEKVEALLKDLAEAKREAKRAAAIARKLEARAKAARRTAKKLAT
jgi:hypothetical protein